MAGLEIELAPLGRRRETLVRRMPGTRIRLRRCTGAPTGPATGPATGLPLAAGRTTTDRLRFLFGTPTETAAGLSISAGLRISSRGPG